MHLANSELYVLALFMEIYLLHCNQYFKSGLIEKKKIRLITLCKYIWSALYNV